ncbi:hypothetical protein MNO14_16230 [Luteimonas sp. S4-F44]|uniref:hypothetical protein n=1 Tax=Luteimonas sp. S4-F44 TaxID=2925842 RepID=UPI001F538FF8|nr:hypothetical protein [Luteimonas sp. S4-F44]UNK42455.1 hypothetical protein MNO14_16230 [Luteimonas sp. S4-F44]
MTDLLVAHRGLSPAAARQRVSRGEPQVKRLAYLPFARKARFLYHQDQYASPHYWDRLHAAILATNGPYARALGSVQAREAVPLEHFLGACGAPIAQKKQLSAQTVLDRMVDANVLVRYPLPGLGMCVMGKETYEKNQIDLDGLAATTRARLVAESVLLDSIKEWLRRLAMVSFNTVRTRDTELPRVGPFAWDLTAPSYLTSVLTHSKGKGVKPGWVVCDVLLIENARLAHVEPFMHKVRSIQVLKNIGRTMFIMVAQRYDADAFKALRSAGIMPATPASLFGKDVADGFRDLVKTLGEAAKGSIDPEKFDQLFSKLGKLEGAIGNMRGAFFELLVGELIRKRAAGQVRLNRICKGEDGIAEVDVYHLNEGIEAQMVECKGIAPGTTVSDEEVSLWLTTRIKRVRHHLQQLGWSGPLPRFELWTSGALSPEAHKRIEKTRQANSSKFELRIVEGEDLRAAVKAVNDSSLLKTFDNHFLPQAAL